MLSSFNSQTRWPWLSTNVRHERQSSYVIITRPAPPMSILHQVLTGMNPPQVHSPQNQLVLIMKEAHCVSKEVWKHVSTSGALWSVRVVEASFLSSLIVQLSLLFIPLLSVARWNQETIAINYKTWRNWKWVFFLLLVCFTPLLACSCWKIKKCSVVLLFMAGMGLNRLQFSLGEPNYIFHPNNEMCFA